MLKKHIVENLYKWEKQSSAPPTQISITPTNLCNLECQSCWKRDETNSSRLQSKSTEITEQKLFEIIEEASQSGVRCVELTGGGEPLVRKSVTVELMKRIKKRSMIGWMTSNGTLFSPDIIKLMIELGWDKLTISLDGPDAETNDFLRPPQGSFQKIIEALSLFRDYKRRLNKNTPQITFNVVVSKYNIDKLSDIVWLASKHGVEGVTFEPVKNLSSMCREIAVDFEKRHIQIMEELKAAQVVASKNNIFTNIDGLMRSPELIKYSGRLLKEMPIKEYKGKDAKLLDIPCIEPWFHIYLEANGNVRPCCVSPGFGENIHQNSLKEIWFGDNFSSFRNAILTKNYPLSCNQCNANLICFSREIQELLKDKLSISPQLDKNEQMECSRRQNRVKILITDTAPLYPPLWGGPRRIWNLYSNFSPDLFDFTYVGVNFKIEKNKKYSHNKIRDGFNEILCAFPPHYYLWNIFENAFLGDHFFDLFVYLWMHTDWHFRYVLNSQNCDIAICSHPWSSLSVDKKSSKFFIYDAHNCEYLLMSQIMKGHPLRHLVLRQVKKIEADACRKSDLILVCSQEEKKEFIDLYKVDPEQIIIVPNGTNISKEKEKREYRNKLSLSPQDKLVIFVGAYYKPNIDAVRFIINNVAPRLNTINFLIVGSVSRAFKSKQKPSNVRLAGYLPDKQLEESLLAADMAINPMSDGSGINIKMLDYMSYGLPIVTTECGARGIQSDGKKPMLISSLDKFVENMQLLINDSQLFSRLSQDGRALVSQHYDWKMISRNLQEVILQEFNL